MKIYYLSYKSDLFYCVVYANNKQEAFNTLKEKRTRLLANLHLPLDISEWYIEEFAPDDYDGILCFY